MSSAADIARPLSGLLAGTLLFGVLPQRMVSALMADGLR